MNGYAVWRRLGKGLKKVASWVVAYEGHGGRGMC